MEKITTAKVPCRGGLIKRDNWIEMSDFYPGFATVLRNFEPSLYGGYRRINGFEPLHKDYPVVNPSGAEGKILTVCIFGNKIIVARKDLGTDSYSYYEYDPEGDWINISSGYTPTFTGVNKIRCDSFNFDGTDKIIFVDGVNPPVCYDGTSWNVLAGNQLDNLKPRYVSVFQNHIFVSGDKDYPHLVAHSAPTDETNWDSSAGGGQIIAGYDVYQIYPWRDRLIVFGQKEIKQISVSGTTFVIDSITKNLGTISSDSVVEANGDLLFMSNDGIRPLEATARNEDFELGSVSKNIQEIFESNYFKARRENINAVVIRGKSQVRFFLSEELLPESNSRAILGGLMASPQGVAWEWSELLGIKVSAITSGLVGNSEIVVHGSYDGKVFRHDVGDSFDGAPINALYQTPFLDFDSPMLRKTLKNLSVFMRAEGDVEMDVGITFDWGSSRNMNSLGPDYLFQGETSSSYYNVNLYNQSFYSGRSLPFIIKHVVGSGMAMRFSFSSNNTLPPYSLQTILVDLTPNGNE